MLSKILDRKNRNSTKTNLKGENSSKKRSGEEKDLNPIEKRNSMFFVDFYRRSMASKKRTVAAEIRAKEIRPRMMTISMHYRHHRELNRKVWLFKRRFVSCSFENGESNSVKENSFSTVQLLDRESSLWRCSNNQSSLLITEIERFGRDLRTVERSRANRSSSRWTERVSS